MDGKSFYKFGLTTIAVLLCLSTKAQENLVPNPSFEENSGCPTQKGWIWLAPPWEKVGGGGLMSYYHECGGECCAIPVVFGGGGYARTGQACADIALLHNNHVLSFFVEGNFIGVELIMPLEAGKKYEVEFFLSLMDSMRFATRNIGVHFSEERPPFDIEVQGLLALEPQIRYDGDFLIDKIGWMKVGGSFVAEGGEQYMIIGNFDGYYNSDTLNLYEGGVIPNINSWELAAYFIDDVSVVKDTTYFVGLEENETLQFGFWPNPATERITIKTDGRKDRSVAFYDVAGKEVFSVALQQPKQAIGIGHLPTGIYVAVLKEKGVAVARRKLMVKAP